MMKFWHPQRLVDRWHLNRRLTGPAFADPLCRAAWANRRCPRIHDINYEIQKITEASSLPRLFNLSTSSAFTGSFG